MTTFAGKLLPTQYKFVNDFDHREVAFIGGYGCGKSVSAACKAVLLASMNLKVAGCLLSPTYGMLIDTLIPTLEEVLKVKGIKYSYKKSPQPVFLLHFKKGTAKIFCRSAENYRRLNSLNLAWAVVDEADLLDRDTGIAMWKVLQGRLRVGVHRQLCATTTPEGFNVMHYLFDVHDKPYKKRYHASTKENYHLPKDYIETLYESYTEREIQAYIDGEFTNLKSGTVYHCFNRKDSHTDETIESLSTDDSIPVLHIGCDFNVGQTSGVVSVIKDNIVYVVGEMHGLRDTEELIDVIAQRYSKYMIYMYPDSSGKSANTATTFTDIALLKDAFGPLHVKFPNKNPRILNRVKSVNAKFLNSLGDRSLLVNTDLCPNLTTCLEQQAYTDAGAPSKKHNVDHPLDALGYFIHYSFAITRKPHLRNI